MNGFEEDEMEQPLYIEEMKQGSMAESTGSHANKLMRSSHASSILESYPTDPRNTHIDMNTGSSHSPAKRLSEMMSNS